MKYTLLLALALLATTGVTAKAEETRAESRTQLKTDVPHDGRRQILHEGREVRADIRQDSKATIDGIRGAVDGRQTPEERMQIKEVKVGARADLKANHASTSAAVRAHKIIRVQAFTENKEAFKLNVENKKALIKAQIHARMAEHDQQITPVGKATTGGAGATSSPERKKKLDEGAKARVKVNLNNIYTRLNAHLNIFTGLDNKIANRLNLLNDKDVDTEKAAAQYKIAQASLLKAKADIEATKIIADEQTATTTSNVTIKALVLTAEASLKNAGVEYKKTIVLLKELKPQATVSATTTVSTGTTTTN